MPDKAEKCLIVCVHYKPLIGGALAVYDALAVCEPRRIQVLTAYIDYTNGREVQGWRQFDASAPYRVHRLPRMRPDLIITLPLLLGRLVNAAASMLIKRSVWRKIEAVVAQENITHVCVASLEALGWVTGKVKKLPNVKSVLYVHGEDVNQKTISRRADRQRKQAFDNADAVVVVSSFTAQAAASLYGVPPAKITTITNGVDIARFRTDETKEKTRPAGMPGGRFVFAFGRLVARKGFDMLIEAWPKVIAACPGVTLCIGGTGPIGKQLESMIAARGLQDSVIMPGRISDEDLPMFYRSADVFASPNRTMPDGDTEGFGLVFLEAAATGTPSIGGNAGGVPDAIHDGKTGLLVDGEDPGAIADALIELLTDEDLRRHMGQAALENAQRNGWDEKAQAFMDLIHSL